MPSTDTSATSDASSHVEEVPEWIMPTDITRVTDDDIVKYLEGIRERRLRAVRVYKKLQAEKERIEDERTRDRLDKEVVQLGKGLARVDKAIDALEDRASKIRALKLQLGIDE